MLISLKKYYIYINKIEVYNCISNISRKHNKHVFIIIVSLKGF